MTARLAPAAASFHRTRPEHVSFSGVRQEYLSRTIELIESLGHLIPAKILIRKRPVKCPVFVLTLKCKKKLKFLIKNKNMNKERQNLEIN
jgi:hypothetical protein